MSWHEDKTSPSGRLEEIEGGRPGQAALLVYHDGGVELVTLLERASIVIGRAAEADVVVPEPTLSRQHARIEVQGPDVWIEDMDSTSGTWIAGERVTRARLRPGDEVSLGRVTLAHHAAGRVEARAVRPPGEAPLEVADRLDAVLLEGAAMRGLLELAAKAARADLPLLIQGETGTGKEIVAQAVHRRSPRGKRPLICCNCGAIPRDLVPSTLFGHERGAFTGADQRRKGLFEEADGGALLLDEVGELTPEAQVALLRVIESGKMTRIGSADELPVDVRVISATHRDLEAMCEAGSFRWDLFFRLNAITLQVPPLRERLDEIAPLARRFVALACEKIGRPLLPIAPDVIELLRRQRWRGNVRELRNVMERAVLVSTGAALTVDDLPEGLRDRPRRSDVPAEAAAAREVDFRQRVQHFERALLARALARAGWNKTAAAQQLCVPLRTLMFKVQSYGLSAPRPLDASDDSGAPPGQLRAEVQRFERELLRAALDETGWKRAEAARRLGLPLSTMLYKLKRYQLAAQPSELGG